MSETLPELRFFSSATEAERAHILSLARAASQDAKRFAERHSMSDLVSSRAWALSAMMAGSYPELRASDIALITKYVLWIFAFDDVMDMRDVQLEALHRIVQDATAIARGGGIKQPHHPLLPGLIELRTAFCHLPAWSDLGTTWTDALCMMQKGMLFESYWRVGHFFFGAEALPSQEQYIDQAWRSVGVSPMLQSVMLLTPDRSITIHQEHLQRLVQLASTAIRYANDLRSETKEREEGSINSIVILEYQAQDRAPATPRATARAEVARRIDDLLGEIAKLTEEVATDSGLAERAIRRAATVLCEFYRDNDYHTFGRPPHASLRTTRHEQLE